MIEFIVFIVFVILQHVLKCFLEEGFYALSMNSMISLFIVFIVFTRFFLRVCVNKFWAASKRYPLLCLFYLFMLIEGCLAVLFFGGDLQRPYEPWNKLTIASQIFMYGCSLIMITMTKIQDFSERKELGKVYTVLHILDLILIAALLICDFILKPAHIQNKPCALLAIKLLLFNLMILNILILHFKKYWLYKIALIKKLENTILINNENSLIRPPKKDLKTNKIMQDLIIVLDKSPIRVLEMNSIVKQLRDLLVKNGRDIDYSNKMAADFSSVIIMNLMKRKNDFSYLPSFVIKQLQKYSKHKSENKRGQLC